MGALDSPQASREEWHSMPRRCARQVALQELSSDRVYCMHSRACAQWAMQRGGSAKTRKIYANSVSEAEMHFGVRLLPEGRRKDLERVVRALFDTLLGGRVLPFDRAAAESFAGLASARRRQGRPVGIADLQIAAIVQARKASLIVTRNTAEFADCGTPLINPWVL